MSLTRVWDGRDVMPCYRSAVSERSWSRLAERRGERAKIWVSQLSHNKWVSNSVRAPKHAPGDGYSHEWVRVNEEVAGRIRVD